MDTAGVCELLRENGFDEEVAQAMLINKIDGATLLDLDSQDLKELGIVALGDRKRLQKLLQGSPSIRSNVIPPKVCMSKAFKCHLFTILSIASIQYTF